ncbi:MAG: hypothetical protein EBT33_23100, partial [Betaproteobacteria bacterium]|nr:hypothetical protein [Betaproteobacteria bacterium]
MQAAGGAVAIREQAAGGDLRISGITAGAQPVSVSLAAGALSVGAGITSTGAVRLESTGSITGAASVQAGSLTLVSGGEIAARSAVASSALPVPAFSVSATTLNAQAGRDLVINNTSTAPLTVTGLSAGSLTQRGDIVFRSMAGAASAEVAAITVSGPVRAQGAGATAELDAGGAQGLVVLGAPISADAGLALSSRLGVSRSNDTAILSGASITLDTAIGSGAKLGTAASPLFTDLQGSAGSLAGLLDGAASLRETAGDLRLGGLILRSADAARTLRLETASGSIIGQAGVGAADLIAGTVSLSIQGGSAGVVASGSAPVDPLRIASASSAPIALDAQAAGGSVLVRTGGSVAVSASGVVVTGNGALLLDAEGAITLGTSGGLRTGSGAISLAARGGAFTQAAGDTFRAAAGDQLETWAQR